MNQICKTSSNKCALSTFQIDSSAERGTISGTVSVGKSQLDYEMYDTVELHVVVEDNNTVMNKRSSEGIYYLLSILHSKSQSRLNIFNSINFSAYKSTVKCIKCWLRMAFVYLFKSLCGKRNLQEYTNSWSINTLPAFYKKKYVIIITLVLLNNLYICILNNRL